MVRLVAAVVALLILPSLAAGQQVTEPRTHIVVDGDCLWNLSGYYYGDPFKWPLIYDANRDVVEDPHWIYPDELLVIPGLDVPLESPETETPGVEEPVEVEVQGVDVVAPAPLPELPPGMERPQPRESTGSSSPRVIRDRTIFYRDPTAGQVGSLALASREYLEVARAAVMSAPWLEPETGATEYVGTISGFNQIIEGRAYHETARPLERLQVTLDEGFTPRVGDELQSFRISRREPGVGKVAAPTGVLMVTRIEGAGAVTVVTGIYDRMLIGDYLRPAPRFDLLATDRAEEVTSDLTATVLGFGQNHQLQSLGDVAFLDVGEPEGIEIGDEFVAIVNAGNGWTGEMGGTLQVVRVDGETCSARIRDLTGPVFETGVTVTLSKKMR